MYALCAGQLATGDDPAHIACRFGSVRKLTHREGFVRTAPVARAKPGVASVLDVS